MEEWNTLETVGKKGNGMKPQTHRIRNAFKELHYYASVGGLILSLITFVLAVVWMKEYTVYFEGQITVQADNDNEATERAYDALKETVPPIQFSITASEED